MLIGVPKEVKIHEYRVGLVPASVRELVRNGHEVLVESGAGAAIGFGLLTVDTLPQAVARSGEDRMNKGAEAAQALLGQVALRRRWKLA